MMLWIFKSLFVALLLIGVKTINREEEQLHYLHQLIPNAEQLIQLIDTHHRPEFFSRDAKNSEINQHEQKRKVPLKLLNLRRNSVSRHKNSTSSPSLISSQSRIPSIRISQSRSPRARFNRKSHDLVKDINSTAIHSKTNTKDIGDGSTKGIKQKNEENNRNSFFPRKHVATDIESFRVKNGNKRGTQHSMIAVTSKPTTVESNVVSTSIFSDTTKSL